MTRTYRAELGASWFTMEDVVENRGYLPVEHMLLYHINAGYPFVDEGSELIAPVAGPPRLLFGTADVNDRTSWSRFIAPQRNWVQQTFEHTMRPDADGLVEVAIFNPKLFGGTGLSVRYDHRVMPNYIEWRMMGEGQYAVGIEPCTNGFGREAVRAAGDLIVLQPGESPGLPDPRGDHRRGGGGSAPGIGRSAAFGQDNCAVRPAYGSLPNRTNNTVPILSPSCARIMVSFEAQANGCSPQQTVGKNAPPMSNRAGLPGASVRNRPPGISALVLS